MSNKALVESIKSVILFVRRDLERDLHELNQLRSADSFFDFATASYKKCFKKITRKLREISVVNAIEAPKYLQMKDSSGNLIAHDSIIESSEELNGIEVEGSLRSSFVVNAISGLGSLSRGIPFFTTSIGVKSYNEDGSAIMKNVVIYDYSTASFYTSTFQNGAYCQGAYVFKLLSSSVSRISSSCVVGFVFRSGNQSTRDTFSSKRKLVLFQKLMNLSIKANNYISIPNPEMGILFVASGRADIFYCYNGCEVIDCINVISLARESGVVLLTIKDNVEIETGKLSDIDLSNGFIVASKAIVPSIMNFIGKI